MEEKIDDLSITNVVGRNYYVVQAEDLATLRRDVIDCLNKGWKLQGGVSIGTLAVTLNGVVSTEIRYAQALTA